MENVTETSIFFVVCGAFVIFAVWWYFHDARKDHAAIAELKQGYDHALQNGNKRDALQWGRAYYSKLRGGKLTAYDEMAIANDLSVIDSAAPVATRAQHIQEMSKTV